MMDKSIGKAFQIDRVIIIFVKDLLVDTQHATTQHFHQQTKKKNICYTQLNMVYIEYYMRDTDTNL